MVNKGKYNLNLIFDISGDADIRTLDRYLYCLKVHLSSALKGYAKPYPKIAIKSVKWESKTNWKKTVKSRKSNWVNVKEGNYDVGID